MTTARARPPGSGDAQARVRHRRSAALTALVLLVVAVVGAVSIAATAFPHGLLMVAFVLLAAPLAWHGVVRRGAARWTSLAIAALLIAGALAVIVAAGPLGGIAVVAALALALPRAAFTVTVELPTAVPPHKAVVFWNPKSGGGKAEQANLASEARKRGIEPVELQLGDDLGSSCTGPWPAAPTPLAAAGGDGTQAIVAAAAAEHGLPYACIPAGTRNHFALDLGVDRDDVVGALDAFVNGGERRIDLAEINGQVFVNNVSLGLYAEAVQQDGYRDAKLRTIFDSVPDGPRHRAAKRRTCGGPGQTERSTPRAQRCSCRTTPIASAPSARARGRASTTACWASPSSPPTRRATSGRAVHGSSGRRRRSRCGPARASRQGSTVRPSCSMHHCASPAGPARSPFASPRSTPAHHPPSAFRHRRGTPCVVSSASRRAARPRTERGDRPADPHWVVTHLGSGRVTQQRFTSTPLAALPERQRDELTRLVARSRDRLASSAPGDAPRVLLLDARIEKPSGTTRSDQCGDRTVYLIVLGVDHPGFQGEIVAELERPVGELPAARREAVERMRGDLGKRGAHQRAGDDVAGVVDAGVYARVGNQGGESAQGDRRRREHVADAGREGEGGGGVAGGERGRRGHAHVAGEREPLRPRGRGAGGGRVA